MPYTTISVDQWARVSLITNFLISDLWTRRFTWNDTDLTTQEKNAILQIGTQVYGSSKLFQKFAVETTADFTESEQKVIDGAAKAFLQKYSVLTEADIIYRGSRGDILNMPLSTITFTEWSQILEIMQYKLGNDAFVRRFNGQSIT